MTTRLIVAGAAGRMGTRIIALAAQDSTLNVVYGLESETKTGGAVPIGPDRSKLKDADAVIDFSAPAASLALIPDLIALKKSWVLGTTGFDAAQEEQVRKAAREIPVMFSPNMSLGVNVLFKLAREASQVLASYNVKIIETHHVHKKDAPSGTALRAGKIIEEAGHQKVNYESLREGEVVGDHRIIFEGVGERFELFHHAESRDTFAAGSLQAAKWLVQQKPGLYTMQDVLGL